MTEYKECYMCWTKDANYYLRFAKTDLQKCLLHLKYIKQFPRETSDNGSTDNQLIDICDCCVWLCLRCSDQCKKILSVHNEIEMNANLLKNIIDTYTSNILFDRNENSPETLLSNPFDRDSSSCDNVPLIGRAPFLTEDNTLTWHTTDAATDDAVSTNTFTVSYGAAPFKCKNCSINFDSYQKLIDHVCATMPECLVCNKVFKTQQIFVEHKNQFNKCFLCDRCPARFHFGKSLVLHQVKQHELMEPGHEHHQTQTIPASSFFERSSSSEPEMTPNLDFSTIMKPTHLEISGVSNSKKRKKGYECTNCSISFPKLKLLQIHGFEVHRNANKYATYVKCSVCSKYVKNYADHMKRHLGILDYCCHICDKKFLREFDLEQHQKRCCIVKI